MLESRTRDLLSTQQPFPVFVSLSGSTKLNLPYSPFTSVLAVARLLSRMTG